MKEVQAVRALASLAHKARLRVFRLLVKCGEQGMPAGKIATKLDLPPATLSFHLKELLNAGLIKDRREGRSIIYAMNIPEINSLLNFLLEDCCGGQQNLCAPSCAVAKERRSAPA
jgi:ArsR family transcriptional regulator, arsenate/arsenite/antimonite-responsive transcriptional repressor